MVPFQHLAAPLLALSLLSLEGAAAQTVQYDVTVIDNDPNAYITHAFGLNDHGQVVGRAIYIPGGLKGWTWTESHGYALLPTPPGQSDFGAIDVNNAGVIAGDGGGDSGQPWRYQNGTYELLGLLQGTAFARTVGISEQGTVAGTCYGTLFYTPHHSFMASIGSPVESVLDDSYAGYINDSDQLTGTAPGSVAYRSTPGAALELLPPLGGRFLTKGHSINNAGDVVGVAKSTLEHSDVPFLFTDSGGMQEVGDFGGRAFARDVNELREVVGDWEPASGSHRPWVWSESQGVRMLADVIDPALGLQMRRTYRINNAGQILCDARDSNSDIVQLLLTPTDPAPTSYCNPPSANSISAGGALLSHVDGQPGGTMVIQIDNTPTRPGVLYFGTSQVDLPFGCGRRCVGGTTVRSGVYSPTGTSFQATLDTRGTATTPFNIQYWYRDPDHLTTCGEAFNLTNALEY